MAIRVDCECGTSVEVPDSAAGKKGKCRACGGPFLVPDDAAFFKNVVMAEDDEPTVASRSMSVASSPAPPPLGRTPLPRPARPDRDHEPISYSLLILCGRVIIALGILAGLWAVYSGVESTRESDDGAMRLIRVVVVPFLIAVLSSTSGVALIVFVDLARNIRKGRP